MNESTALRIKVGHEVPHYRDCRHARIMMVHEIHPRSAAFRSIGTTEAHQLSEWHDDT
jgi:hypothetical protein